MGLGINASYLEGKIEKKIVKEIMFHNSLSKIES